MSSNRRFAVAVYVLALARIAKEEAAGVPITSEQMAASVAAHPVYVRRVLGELREAGLVNSQPGPGGGWRLSRPPETITLRDVFRAIDREPLFGLPCPPQQTNADCAAVQCLPAVLSECFQEAEAALEARLAQVTLADLIGAVRAEANRAGLSPFSVGQETFPRL